MNCEEIIKMARNAGMERVVAVHPDGTRTIELPHPDLLLKFANLVASAEREACAQIVERNAAVCIHSLTLWDVLNANALAIRARGNTNER